MPTAHPQTQFGVLRHITPLLQYQLVVLAVPVVLSLSGGIFAFVLMPALDIILGNEVHEAQAVPSPLQGPELYQGVLWAYAAFHFLLLFTTCALVSTHTLSPLAFAGMLLQWWCCWWCCQCWWWYGL